MKKYLLSIGAGILAVGLLTGCGADEEEPIGEDTELEQPSGESDTDDAAGDDADDDADNEEGEDLDADEPSEDDEEAQD